MEKIMISFANGRGKNTLTKANNKNVRRMPRHHLKIFIIENSLVGCRPDSSNAQMPPKTDEKFVFLRLLKNAQMQDASFDRLRINSILTKDEGCRCDE
jgi:hypothetical protein